MKPSELDRARGLQLPYRYGISLCPKCHFPLIVHRGQKTRRCKKCHKLYWLPSDDPVRRPIYSSNSHRLVLRIQMGITGWLGSGKFFIPTWKFKEWERKARKQAQERAEVRLFMDHLPWNLQARRVEPKAQTPTSGDRAEHVPMPVPKSASDTRRIPVSATKTWGVPSVRRADRPGLGGRTFRPDLRLMPGEGTEHRLHSFERDTPPKG